MGAKILDCTELFTARFRENVGHVPEWILKEDTLDLETLKDQYVHGGYHDCHMVMEQFEKYCKRYLIDGNLELLEERLMIGLDLDCTASSLLDQTFVKCFDVYPLDPKHIYEAVSDPFAWHDCKYKTTLRLLEIQVNPISIRTRSDLVAHDQYLEYIQVGSTVTFLYTETLKNGQRSEADAGFPSYKRLQRAADKLKQHGVNVQWEKVCI